MFLIDSTSNSTQFVFVNKKCYAAVLTLCSCSMVASFVSTTNLDPCIIAPYYATQGVFLELISRKPIIRPPSNSLYGENGEHYTSRGSREGNGATFRNAGGISKICLGIITEQGMGL